MAVTQLAPVLHHIRHLAFSASFVGPTDGQLLEQYLLDGNEEAFAVLVRRHGPMVLGVCRRVLGTIQDAEDAFQATFLQLIRNAARIVKRESVGSWLHGVAYRTSLKAKTAARRRRIVERQAPVAAAVEYQPESAWRELRPLLDEEIGRLPERYRLPVMLCYLEGKTNTEAAGLLRWPKGTVATRLAWARQLLRTRLTQRGAALAAGGLAVATVPASLRASVVQTAQRIAAGKMGLTGVVSERAIALAKGVMRTMWITKMRLMAVAVFALGTIGGGAGFLLHRTAATTDAVALQDNTTAGARPLNGGDTEEKSEVRVYQLRNAAAADVANSVMKFLTENLPELKDKASAQAEPRTNRLLITAPPQQLEKILRVVKELDADQPQILMQVVVMEVGANGEKDILCRPQIMTLDNQTARFFIGQQWPVLQRPPSDPPAAAIPNPPYPKPLPMAQGTVNDPPLPIMPSPSGPLPAPMAAAEVNYDKVGVELALTPRIQPDGKMLVRVQFTHSEAELTNVSLGNGNFATTINQDTMEQTLTAGDGETVTMTGNGRRKEVQEYKVPVLSEIPIWGKLLHFRRTSTEPCEVRVQLTPHIVHNRFEANHILTEETDKTDRLVEKKSAALPD